MHKHFLVAGIAVLLGVITFTQVQTIGSVNKIVGTLQNMSVNQVGAVAALTPGELAIRETTRIDLLKTVVSSSTNPIAWGYITSLADVNCQLRNGLGVPCTKIATEGPSLAIVSPSVSKYSCTVTAGGITVACGINMTFAVKNNSTHIDLFLSKSPSLALATSSTPFSASSSLSSITIPPNTGDAVGSYRIAAGTSRLFSYNGMISRNGSGAQKFSITMINLGTSDKGPWDLPVTKELESLYVAQTF